MSVYTFTPQLKIGQAYEQTVKRLFEKKGAIVEENIGDYEQLKGCDLIVTKDGRRWLVEVKLDVMSQKTGNVCVELEAMFHSKSELIVYGLPQDQWTDMYIIPRLQLLQFARDYPIKKFVGQWKTQSAIIPIPEFITLPFVKRFTLEKLDPYGLHKWKHSSQPVSSQQDSH